MKSNITLLLLSIAALVPVGINAQSPESVKANAGLFKLGPFEYYAEERVDQPAAAPNSPKLPHSKLWLLPTLVVLPESV